MWGDVDDPDQPLDAARAHNALRHILWGVPISLNAAFNIMLINMPGHLPVVSVVVHDDGHDFVVGYADVGLSDAKGCGMPATVNNLLRAIFERALMVLRPLEEKAKAGSEWHTQALIKTMRAAENTALTILFQPDEEKSSS